MVLHHVSILHWCTTTFLHDHLKKFHPNGVWKSDMFYVLDTSCYVGSCYVVIYGRRIFVRKMYGI